MSTSWTGALVSRLLLLSGVCVALVGSAWMVSANSGLEREEPAPTPIADSKPIVSEPDTYKPSDETPRSLPIPSTKKEEIKLTNPLVLTEKKGGEGKPTAEKDNRLSGKDKKKEGEGKKRFGEREKKEGESKKKEREREREREKKESEGKKKEHERERENQKKSSEKPSSRNRPEKEAN